MWESCAYLVQDILQDFSVPLEVLHPENVMKALAQSLAARGLARQQSEEGRLTKVVPISLPTRDSVLSDAPDAVIPLYVERLIGYAPYETWQWIPPIGKDAVEEARMRGDLRCSFYKEDPTGNWHVVLTYEPDGVQHRLNYYTDPAVAVLLGDPLPLPARFAYMFRNDAIINVIPPLMMRNAALGEDQQLNSGQLAAINAMLGHAQSQNETQWNGMWEKENNQEKATRGRMRRPILSHSRPR